MKRGWADTAGPPGSQAGETGVGHGGARVSGGSTDRQETYGGTQEIEKGLEEIQRQRGKRQPLPEFGFEVELVEGGEQEENDTGGQDEDHDGVGVMVVGAVEMELVDELVEALVFNLPACVTDAPDGLGGGLRKREGGDPIPVGGDPFSTDWFGFVGADHTHRVLHAGPRGEALEVPPLILSFPQALFQEGSSLAEALGVGEEIGVVVLENGDEVFVVGT